MKAGWGSTAKAARKGRQNKAPTATAQEVAELPATSARVERAIYRCPVCRYQAEQEVEAGHRCGGACNYRSEMVRV